MEQNRRGEGIMDKGESKGRVNPESIKLNDILTNFILTKATIIVAIHTRKYSTFCN